MSVLTQSQRHGFIFENIIRTMVFNLPEHMNDTNVYDIPCSENPHDPTENVSIKTTGNDTIYCGDIMRFFQYDFSKKNTIIVVQYKQTDTHKVIRHIYQIDYNASCHKHLFGNLTREVLKTYVESVKEIPIKVKGNDAKKIFSYLDAKKDIEKQHIFNIKINPKVDSSQSRVQCSICNFTKTLGDFILTKSSVEMPSRIRGIDIPLSIESEKRKRNKNNKQN